MKIIKRAIQSAIHLKKRTLILGLLFLLVMTFLITGASLQGAMNNILEKNKENVNPIVSIETDLDLLMREMTSGDMGKNNRQQINDTLVEKVKKSKYVKDYSVYGNARTPENLTVSVFDSTNAKVAKNSIDLLKGKMPQDSKEKSPVVVSESYAKENDIKIGDTIKLNLNYEKNAKEKKEYPVTVSGIYKLSSESSDIAKQQESSTLLGTAKLVTAINEKSFEGESAGVMSPYDKIKIELKNPMETEKFIKEIKKGDADFTGVVFNSSYKEYKSISSMIDNLTGMFSMLKIITIVVAGVIISLIMLLSLRERKYEIGLLLSLGEKKANILLQMFLEVVIVLIVSTAISLAVSNFMVTPYATNIVNEKMETTMMDYKPAEGMPRGPLFEEDDSVKLDAKTEIDAQEGTGNTVETSIIFLIILGITGLSTVIPTTRIIRKSPKNILSSTE